MGFRTSAEIERRGRHRGLGTLILLSAVSGCVTYEPHPLDPLAILRELEAETLNGTGPSGSSGPAPEMKSPRRPPGFTARQAAAWAVAHNPSLAALRADLGIARAELLRAGLLPDPVLGWDAADALAARLSGQAPKKSDYLSGIGLSWQVPRPGEISALIGGARARTEEVRQKILATEWLLVRQVHAAFLDVFAARARLALNGEIRRLTRRTADFFEQALEVKGATAIQANLAAVDLASLEPERVRLQGDLRRVLLSFNALLGLPPEIEVPLEFGTDPLRVEARELDAAELARQAVRKRPDLARLSALYLAAEEDLRLEISRQWPQLAIGTGLFLVLPIFSRFNHPAIRSAIARRERLGRALRAAVHALRAEVHGAAADLDSTRREVQTFEKTLIPAVRKSLRLTDRAFAAREVTLVEILTAQRQVLEARKSYLEARIRSARARLVLKTVTGEVLMETVKEGDEHPPAEKKK